MNSAQLLFDLLANERMVFRLDREEMRFCRLVVHYVIRLLLRHPRIVTGGEGIAKGCRQPCQTPG
jgi:hypothetical protein